MIPSDHCHGANIEPPRGRGIVSVPGCWWTTVFVDLPRHSERPACGVADRAMSALEACRHSAVHVADVYLQPAALLNVTCLVSRCGFAPQISCLVPQIVGCSFRGLPAPHAFPQLPALTNPNKQSRATPGTRLVPGSGCPPGGPGVAALMIGWR